MWFSNKFNLFSSNSKRVVHPLKTTSKIEVSEYFNGKDVKMRLIIIDEFGGTVKCQEYINMHNGDFYDHHTFGELNYNKRNICDKLKATFDSEKLPQICAQN